MKNVIRYTKGMNKHVYQDENGRLIKNFGNDKNWLALEKKINAGQVIVIDYEASPQYQEQLRQEKQINKKLWLEAIEREALRPLLAAFALQEKIKESGESPELLEKLATEKNYLNERLALIEFVREEK